MTNGLDVVEGERTRRGPGEAYVLLLALLAVSALACAATVGTSRLVDARANSLPPSRAQAAPVAGLELVSTLSLPGPPVGLAVGRARVAVSTALAGVVLVRRSDGRIAGRVGVDGAATSIAADGRRFWVVDLFRGRAMQLDEGGTLVDEFTVGDLPAGIALSRGGVWVLELADAQITVADRYRLLAPVRLQFEHDELWPGAIASGSDGIWLATGHRTSVILMDPEQFIVMGRAVVPGVSLLAATTGGVWAAGHGAGPELVRVDGATFATAPVDLPGTEAVTALAGGVSLAVATRGVINVLDPETGEVRARGHVEPTRELVQLAFDGGDLWALDAASEELLRFRVGSRASATPTAIHHEVDKGGHSNRGGTLPAMPPLPR